MTTLRDKLIKSNIKLKKLEGYYFGRCEKIHPFYSLTHSTKIFKPLSSSHVFSYPVFSSNPRKSTVVISGQEKKKTVYPSRISVTIRLMS